MKIEQLNVLKELLNEFRYEVQYFDYSKVKDIISLVSEVISEKEEEDKRFEDDAYVIGVLEDKFRFISKVNSLAKGTVYSAHKDGKSYIVSWSPSGKERYTERGLYDAIERGDFVIIK